MNIMIFNQKGGVGKTTTALNLGAALARWGDAPVTLVDLDPQTHLSAAMGFRTETLNWNVSDWLSGNGNDVQHINERLDLVPGDCDPKQSRPVTRTRSQNSGHLLIDAPPTWNSEVETLLADCDWILTPMEPEFLSMQGISRLMQRMEASNIPWSRLRMLLCRYDDRLGIHREVRSLMAKRFGPHMVPVVVRNNISLAESPGHGKNIFDYAPSSAGAADYFSLAHTMMADKDWRRSNPP